MIPRGGPRRKGLLRVWAPPRDPTVFPAALTSEPPRGRGGMSHLSWALEPPAEGAVI